MAIEKMMLANIIGKLSDLDDVIKSCCEKDDFHPERAITYLPVKSGYTQLIEENPYAKYMDKFTDLSKRMKIELSDEDTGDVSMTPDEISEYADRVSKELDELSKRRKELLELSLHDTEAIDQLVHFKGFDLNLNEIFKSEFIKVRFGRIPNDSFSKLTQYEDNPYVMFVPCESDDSYHWGVYFSPLEEVSEIDRIFSNLYFERLRVPDAAGTPEQAVDSLSKEIAKNKEEIAKIDKQLAEIWDTQKQKLSLSYAHIKHRFTLFSMRSYAAKYKDYFHIMGFVPAHSKKEFEERLSKHSHVEYSIEKPGRDSRIEPPVLLKNNKIVKPYEMYVEMYGLPGYNEIDPTFFVALTYSVMFGIMFADVGQGLVLILAGWYMSKKRKMALGSILTRCGVFAILFGALMGSVFGFENLFDGFYHKTLGIHFLPFQPMNASNITSILIAAISIGVFLVIIAMCLSIFVSLRQKRYGNAVFGASGITGLVLYLSIIFLVIDKFLLKTGATNLFFVLLTILLPVILLFFREPFGSLIERKKDWMPENWGEFMIQNFFELFEMLLSYVTNTLSFLRVGAFVLVHAGMMMVVHILAGGGVAQMIIVFIIGNIFVIGMEGLLVGIQSLRLEFYEMFSRFFEGRGHAFKPIK